MDVHLDRLEYGRDFVWEHRSAGYDGGGAARTPKLTGSGAEAIIGTGTDDTVKVYRDADDSSLYALSDNRGQGTAGLAAFHAAQTEPYVTRYGAQEGRCPRQTR